MKESTVRYYQNLEEQDRVRRSREFQPSENVGRASHAMTTGWERYRPSVSAILVHDAWGNVRRITPQQHLVLNVARTHEGEQLKATVIANSLGVAVSTVTRALVRLAAFGLVAYDTVRGRNGGITFMATAWADLKGRSRGAWSKIRAERQKMADRFVRRLERSHYFTAGLDLDPLNVATYTSMDATFSGQGS